MVEATLFLCKKKKKKKVLRRQKVDKLEVDFIHLVKYVKNNLRSSCQSLFSHLLNFYPVLFPLGKSFSPRD